MTNNDPRDHDPSYSPDGSKIIFSEGNAEYSNIDLAIDDLNDGKESDVFDDSGANGGSTCWAVDGKKVYFHSLNLERHPVQIKELIVSS